MCMTKFGRWLTKGVLLIVLWGATGSLYAQTDYKILSVKFEGNEKLKSQALKEQMNTRANSLKDKALFWKRKPRFSTFTFRSDIDRLQKYYQQNGYLNATLVPELGRNNERKTLQITIRIDEGIPVLIDSVKLALTDNSKLSRLIDSCKTVILTRTGEIFKDESVSGSTVIIEKALSDVGYPFTSVNHKLSLTPDTAKVNITYNIVTGPETTFGSTNIHSDSHVPESYIRNQLKYREGELYSKALLEKTQQKLFDTDLFQYVVVRSLRDSMSNGKLPVIIQMKEKPRWSIETGVGYGSADNFRVSAEITRRQFLGGARKLVLKAKHSRFFPISAELKFIQPAIILEKTNLIVNPFFIKEEELSYHVERLGGNITFQHEFSENNIGYLSWSTENNKLSYLLEGNEKKWEEISYNKAGITVGGTISNTDNLLEPTRGQLVNAYFSWFGPGFKTRYHYIKFEADARKYFHIDDQWTLATKLKIGVMQPVQGDTVTPIADRFLLGGQLSLRGWGHNSIGASEYVDTVVGGNSMLELGTELRYPIWDIFSGVLFAEAGNVWTDSFYFDLSDLYCDFGIGVRIKTPIGPIRFDYATPVFNGGFNGIFIVSIGQAF